MLADGAVRHVGDPVAFIVAETHAGRRATPPRRSMVDYDMLPSGTDLATAMDAGRAAGLARGARTTSCFDWEIGDKAKTEALFARPRT